MQNHRVTLLKLRVQVLLEVVLMINDRQWNLQSEINHNRYNLESNLG